MNIVLAIAAGGAAGSVLRHALATAVHRVAGTTFPLGTLLVNVAGSFAIGVLYVWLIERAGARPEMRAFLMVGVLGGFTTFSSFSMETISLMMDGNHWRAALNVLASVALCLLGTALGVALARG